MFVSPFATPTQLSFQIISFCCNVHAMKIYLNRKYRTIGMILCTSCSPQSCIIEYKVLCKNKCYPLLHPILHPNGVHIFMHPTFTFSMLYPLSIYYILCKNNCATFLCHTVAHIFLCHTLYSKCATLLSHVPHFICSMFYPLSITLFTFPKTLHFLCVYLSFI